MTENVFDNRPEIGSGLQILLARAKKLESFNGNFEAMNQSELSQQRQEKKNRKEIVR